MSEQRRQSRFESGDDVVVMKFGGTSVEDAAAIRRLISIVQNKLDSSAAQPVLVVSALVNALLLVAPEAAVAAPHHTGLAKPSVFTHWPAVVVLRAQYVSSAAWLANPPVF